MITAVDTNVLIDILEPDPVKGRTSLSLLRRAMHQGAVVACEVVWAEVATAYGAKALESSWRSASGGRSNHPGGTGPFTKVLSSIP